MFAYNQKTIFNPITSSDISGFGHQALLRALNIGRVVAFTGSGVNYSFGQPQWGELGLRATKLFFVLENSILESDHWKLPNEDPTPFQREFKRHVTNLVREIKRLVQKEKNNTLHFISLVETYFESVEELIEIFRIPQVDFCSSFEKVYKSGDAFTGNVIVTFWDEARKAKPAQHIDSVMSMIGEGIAASDEIKAPPVSKKEFRAVFAKRFSSWGSDGNLRWGNGTGTHLKENLDELFSAAKFDSVKTKYNALLAPVLQQFNDLENLDASRALHTKLKVNRFMTLNYDLELEQMLFEEARSVPVPHREKFENFLNIDQADSKSEVEPGHAIELTSGSGRLIRSTSSRSDSLADLFSFGAFPTNFNTSVHHLHGRIDDPANMIIIPQDYQRIYYGSGDQPRSFDEARHAVFTGSDILFAGVGHSEHDVLKPLRTFLELETDRHDQHGNVYYLTATNFNSITIKEDHSFSDIIENAMAANQDTTQDLFQTYGIYVLHTDFEWGDIEEWETDFATLLTARIFVARHFESKDSKWSLNQVTNWASQKFSKDKAAFEDDSNAGVRELKLAALVVEQGASGAITGKAVEPILEGLNSRLQSIGLVRYIDQVRKKQHEWWRSWSSRPGYRLAIYGPHGYQRDNDRNRELKFCGLEQVASAKNPLVWRQTNLITRIGNMPIHVENDTEVPQFNSIFQKTHAAAYRAVQSSQDEKGNLKFAASILRIGMPSGSGKGRLVSFLSSPQPIANQTPIDNDQPRDHWSKDRDIISTKPGPTSHRYVFPFQFLFHRKKGSVGELLERDDRVEMIGCFSAHLTFILEFTSMIAAVSRFLQAVLPQLMQDEVDKKHKESQRYQYLKDFVFHEEYSNRDLPIYYLRTMLSFLVKACPTKGWSKRLVLIFSYLDRLVDERGDGYSPLHREFFRMISGWQDEENHKRLPFDLVLINCDPTRPIRYLSKEKQYEPDGSRRGDAAPSAAAHYRYSQRLSLEMWEEVNVPKVTAVMDEAMSFIISSNWEAACKTLEAKQLKSLTPADVRLEIETAVGVNANSERPETVPPTVHAFASKRVLYGFCLASLAFEHWHKAVDLCGEKSTEQQRIEQLQKSWRQSMIDLSIAINQSKTTGFVSELMRAYRVLDQKVDGSGRGVQLYRDAADPESVEQERLSALVVNHMALFDCLIPASVLMRCPEIRALDSRWRGPGDKKKMTRDRIEKTLLGLVKRGLASAYWEYGRVIAAECGQEYPALTQDNVNEFVFALDTKVSSSVRAETRLSVYGHHKEVPFQTSLYAAQAENSVKPELAHYKMVRRIVRQIVHATHDKMLSLDPVMKALLANPDKAKFDDLRRKLAEYSELLRSAYSLVRGTFSIGVISRLRDDQEGRDKSRPFDEYRSWIRKLLNGATLLNELTNKLQSSKLKELTSERDRALLFNQPFFRDEVTWLYNERAMVSFIQGRLFDALPLFQLALKTTTHNGRSNDPVSYRAGERRIMLNDALAKLERGQIRLAESRFDRILMQTEKRWDSDTPSWINTFASGYKGLCLHLSDDLDGAEKYYKEAIDKLTLAGQLRGQSIFRRHYADLLRARSRMNEDKNFHEAIHQLNSAEQISESIQAVDLQHYTLIARARLQRDMDKRGEALSNLRKAEQYARTMGLQKMLAEVQKVRGEVLLAEGEATQAGFVTAQSVAMSKRNGMRLRKIAATIVQAQILDMREQSEDARRLLQETLLEAQTYDYAIKTSAASKLLSKL